MKLLILLIAKFFLFLSSLKAQDTLHVPSEFSEIQTAIDSSNNGDLILVADGIYYENINYNGKAITVASNFIIDGDTNHINNTIIDGSQNVNPDSGSVVYFVSGEDTTSILKGFTITGGSGTLIVFPGSETDRIAGGIFIDNSGSKMTHNRIVGNNAVMSIPGTDLRLAVGGGLGAVTVDPHSLLIENNLIDSNMVSSVGTAYGGGIVIVENSVGAYNVNISNNTITNNIVVSTGVEAEDIAVSGGILCVMNRVTIINNNLSNNNINSVNLCIGAGLTLAGTSAEEDSRIESNIIINNSFQNAPCLGGGIHLSGANGVTVASNVIKNNSATVGGGLLLDTSVPFLSKNLIAGNASVEAGGGILIDY
jgi:cytoskeletal protein CcmA (bactofilin family)